MLDNNKAKLDKADRIILAELDKNCRTSTKIIAKKARKSRQSVEYRIKQLVENGIITSFNAAINPHKMGYKIYKTYFQLRNVPAERQKLFNYLRTCGNVYWMGECDGAWDLIFASFAKTDYEFYSLKNNLISTFGNVIVKSHYEIIVDVMQYPKMYFTGEQAEPTMFGGNIVDNELNELDHAILGEVVNDARIPMTKLATKVGSHPERVADRLKKLEKMGVIIQYRIGINLKMLGREHYKAILHMERYSSEDGKKLLEYISGITSAQYLIRNIGDIEPEVVVEDYHEYRQFVEKLKENFPFVIKNVESVLMKTDEWTPGYKNLLGKK